MSVTRLQEKLTPTLLLLVFFSIIYFFVVTIGDPTQKNISNNSAFTMKSAYFITPLETPFLDIIPASQLFTPSQIKDIPWSFEQHTYWLKIIIHNKYNESKKLVSHFNNPMLDRLDIFQVDQKGNINKRAYLGDHTKELSFEQRITPNFKFIIAPISETTLYIRIVSTGITNTPIHIYSESEFSVLLQGIHLIWGIFIGVAIIIALYNLVLYFAVKDSVYLIYNGYILSIVALMGVVLGYGFYLFPIPLQLVFNQQVIALNCLVAIFALLFLVYFLKFHEKKQWHYWLAIATVCVLGSLLIISLWLAEYITAQLFFILMPGVYIVCFILLLAKLRAGLQWGKLYLYSWIPLLIGAAIQPLVLTGVIEYSFLSHHAFMIAILLEVLLMAMALAARIRFQRELAIFQATHDLSTALPNTILFETTLSQMLADNKEFASCLIEIKNYQTLAPYMPSKGLQQLELSVIKDIQPLLNSELRITAISSHDKSKNRLAKVADGKLMFIFETSERHTLSEFLNLLQKSIIRELQLNGLLVELKTKIGICFSAESPLTFTPHEFIQYPQLAIEQNRESDDHLHYYHDLEVLNIKDHLTLACDLQSAIRENQLHLYHQPQIDLNTGHVYGSEVLLRWQHPEHGFISPELFVRIAEDTGLINELTRWVIDCAFKQLQRLHAHDQLAHKVSINISGKDIGLPNFLHYVKEKMKAFSIPPNVIIFELTESVMVTDFAVLESLMVALNKIGIKVSIDDYGTGYSSLNYISQLNFDELKIDKAFILDLDRSQRNLSIVKTTIDMAKNLDLVVVAEGVESKQIEHRLIESGCHIGQGYYYSQPLSFDKYLLWLDNHSR